MLRKLQKPISRYIRYYTRRADNGRYQIKIIYFIDTGNPISDSNVRREKTILCDERNLQTLESKIERNISKTQKRIEKAFYDIGALPRNVFLLMNERMK